MWICERCVKCTGCTPQLITLKLNLTYTQEAIIATVVVPGVAGLSLSLLSEAPSPPFPRGVTDMLSRHRSVHGTTKRSVLTDVLTSPLGDDPVAKG